jgi:hypothetical protein
LVDAHLLALFPFLLPPKGSEEKGTQIDLIEVTMDDLFFRSVIE